MKSQDPPSSALGDREVAICGRFREARLRLKWKMPDFARELEIPRDRLASYEYARSPIRYSLARQMCDRFNINQRWLATGCLPSRHYVDVHEYVEAQIPDKMLFSEAYDTFLAKLLDNQIAQLAKSLHCKENEIENNWQRIGVAWPVGSPGAQLSELYHERLLQLRLHQQPDGVQKRIYKQLNEILDQLLPGGIALTSNTTPTPKNKSKLYLDKTDGLPDVPSVQNQIRNLKDLVAYLKKVTAGRGAKAALAREFGVTRQAVNQWLSGESAPSADIAIRLQHWKPKPAK